MRRIVGYALLFLILLSLLVISIYLLLSREVSVFGRLEIYNPWFGYVGENAWFGCCLGPISIWAMIIVYGELEEAIKARKTRK